MKRNAAGEVIKVGVRHEELQYVASQPEAPVADLESKVMLFPELQFKVKVIITSKEQQTWMDETMKRMALENVQFVRVFRFEFFDDVDVDADDLKRAMEEGVPDGVQVEAMLSCTPDNLVDIETIADMIHDPHFQDVNFHVRIHSNDVRDVSRFAGASSLTLFDCNDVEEVSSLGNMHHLHLDGCKRITDVSALGGVQYLELNNIPVSDVSALKTVPRLEVFGCRNVQDFSCLGGVNDLYIGLHDDNLPLNDLSPFAKCHRFALSNHKTLADVSPLKECFEVKLHRCDKLADVSPLGDCTVVGLVNCKTLTDVSSLGSCRVVDLRYSSGVQDLSALTRVRRIELHDSQRDGLKAHVEKHTLSAHWDWI